jgi:nucleotide-binding universal stress UspA family protein
MKTILVPLDGSALAEQALPYARMLAAQVGARIRLLRVIADSEGDIAHMSEPALLREAGATNLTSLARETRLWDMLRYYATGYLDGQAGPLLQDGLDVDIDVQIGAPAERIVEVAQQIDAHMIVMATHGYTGFKRWTLGSVADRVVQATKTPVFVVPGYNAKPSDVVKLRRIMLTLDGSELARQALPLASELATHAHAELLLFQVVSPVASVYSGLVLPPDIQDAIQGAAANELRTIADTLRLAEIKVATAVVLGDPADQIVATALKHQVDLVVMATHGYSGIKRWALGSVADKVLHATPAPLLLVRARPETTY